MTKLLKTFYELENNIIPRDLEFAQIKFFFFHFLYRLFSFTDLMRKKMMVVKICIGIMPTLHDQANRHAWSVIDAVSNIQDLRPYKMDPGPSSNLQSGLHGAAFLY